MTLYVRRYAGVLHLTICSAKDLRSKDTIGKSDPYVVARVGNGNTEATSVQKNTHTPNWGVEGPPNTGEVLALNVESLDNVLTLECMDSDHDQGAKNTEAGRDRDEKLGIASITVREFVEATELPFHLPSWWKLRWWTLLRPRSPKRQVVPSASMPPGCRPQQVPQAPRPSPRPRPRPSPSPSPRPAGRRPRLCLDHRKPVRTDRYRGEVCIGVW